MAPLLERNRTFPTSEEDRKAAKKSSRQLRPKLKTHREMNIQLVEVNKPMETVAIPATALRLLLNILEEMAKGNAITIIPIHAEMTTQQAADILNVSRPFLIEQLETGKIPYRKIGTHRRIKFNDIMQYKDKIDKARLESLRQLTEQAQELGMGY